MKVLIVEDSAAQRAVLVELIRKSGNDPLACESGEQAVALFTDRDPGELAIDLVLLGIEMPGIDGFETTRRIRKLLGNHWIPIVFLSSHSKDDTLVRGIRAGGDDYLTKPVSPAILEAKLAAMARIADMRDELRRANAELARLSESDALTGLYNRGAFDRMAAKLWGEARRQRQPISVVLLDIDHFKQFNDNYGHQAGDQCIRDVAEALQKSLLRSSDSVARYGGEEFIMLLANTGIDGAMGVAERARKKVSWLNIEHAHSSAADHVTISLGLACDTPGETNSLQQLIEAADQALYRSKGAGRNRATAAQAEARAEDQAQSEAEAEAEAEAGSATGSAEASSELPVSDIYCR